MARGIDTLYTQEGEKVTISKTEGGEVLQRGTGTRLKMSAWMI